MNVKNRFGLLFVISAIFIAFAMGALPSSALDKQAIAEKVMMEKHKYQTVAGDFDPELKIGEYIVTLQPGELPEVPEGAALGEGIITWKDIAEYENNLARDPDPIAQWFVENRWRDRINRALSEIENKLKTERPYDYHEINISIEDVREALGITPPIGFLTGQPFAKIPAKFGGRLPAINPKTVERTLETSRYLSTYVSSNPFIKETLEKVDDPETTIQPASEAF